MAKKKAKKAATSKKKGAPKSKRSKRSVGILNE